MKTAVSIPDDLYQAAELAAEQLGLSRSELYRRALGAYLRDREDEGVTKALNEVYAEGRDDGRLDRHLSSMQNATVSGYAPWPGDGGPGPERRAPGRGRVSSG